MLDAARLLCKRLTAPVRHVVRRRVPMPLVMWRVKRIWRRPEPAAWPLRERAGRPGLERHEYSLFSQNGEDGILRHLFAEIGFASRRSVEFGFSTNESNSLRLALHERFKALFLDGSDWQVERFNRAAASLGLADAQAVRMFLTRENLQPVLLAHGTPAEIDLLSIDVDGNDYWLWESLDRVSARVTVMEYNAALGPEVSLSMPYAESGRPDDDAPHHFAYSGASLAALARLARRKGSSLVGCDSSGTNAFFVRDDCLTPALEPLTPAAAFRPNTGLLRLGLSLDEQVTRARRSPFVEIA
jgi:hypothetical protein